MQEAMSFVIDTAVVITAEPFDAALEPLHHDVAKFLRLTSQHGHHVWAHSASLDDFAEARAAATSRTVPGIRKYPLTA